MKQHNLYKFFITLLVISRGGNLSVTSFWMQRTLASPRRGSQQVYTVVYFRSFVT